MKQNQINFGSGNFLLPLALGLYFFAVGILGLMGQNSFGGKAASFLNGLTGSSGSLIATITAVASLVAGVILLIGPFGLIHQGFRPLFMIIILVLWVIKSVYELFIAQRPFDPQALVWLRDLALDLVILAALWQVREN